MPEQKISPGLIVIAGGLALGAVTAVGVYALARARGFALSIMNPPAGSTHWTAEFWSEEEGVFIYPAEPLALDETWDCPYNPYGATDLRIRVLDMVNAVTLLDAPNLGPVESGGSYVFDCATGDLLEV